MKLTNSKWLSIPVLRPPSSTSPPLSLKTQEGKRVDLLWRISSFFLAITCIWLDTCVVVLSFHVLVFSVPHCVLRGRTFFQVLLPELSAKNFDISGSSKCLSTKRTFFPHQDFSILSFEYLVDCRSGMQGKLESVSEIFFQSSVAISFFVGFWLSKWFCFCWTFWWPSRFPGIISWRCCSNFKTSSVHVVAVTLHLYERLFPHFRCVVLSFFTLLISTLLRVTNGFHCCVLRS